MTKIQKDDRQNDEKSSFWQLGGATVRQKFSSFRPLGVCDRMRKIQYDKSPKVGLGGDPVHLAELGDDQQPLGGCLA